MHLPTSKKRGRPTGGAALASPIAADPASPVSDATRGAGSSANSSSPIHAAAPQPPPAQPPAASDTFKRPRSARRGLLPAGAAAAPTTAASEASGSNGTEEANPQSRIKSRLLLPAYYLRGLLASIIVPADAAPSEKQGGPWTKFVTLFLGVPHGGSAGASAGLPPPLVGSRPSSLRLPARPPASPAPSRSNASVWDEEDDENEEQQQAQQEPGQGSEQERAPSSPSPSTQPSPATAAAEQEQQQRGAEWWGEVPGIAEEIMGGLDVKGLARLGQTCRALKLAADAFASYVVRKDFPLVPVGPRALGATVSYHSAMIEML